MVQGSSQVPHVMASFASVSNVDLSRTAEVTYSSSNPSVISITSDGLVKAMAPGSATVTASLGGVNSSQDVTVFPKQVMLTHRYSFDSDASDSVGAQDGMVFGNVQIAGGQAAFDGNMNNYIELPSRMISTYDSVSIEAWASFGVNAIWSRVYDFGHYGTAGDGGAASNPYAFLCPHTGGNITRVVLKDTAEAVLDLGTPLDGLNNLHVVVVYDPPSNTQMLFTNGVLAASGSLSGKVLSSVDDLKCWLGRSMFAGDNGLTASIDEFRIYAGVLSPAQVTADFNAGPGTVVLPPPVSADRRSRSPSRVRTLF